MTSSETDHDPSDEQAEDGHGAAPGDDDLPAVLSPGDSDAPDAPDPGTIYPDEPGTPGPPEE